MALWLTKHGLQAHAEAHYVLAKTLQLWIMVSVLRTKTGLPSHGKRCSASALTAAESEQLTIHPAWNVASLSICKVTWHLQNTVRGKLLLEMHKDKSREAPPVGQHRSRLGEGHISASKFEVWGDARRRLGEGTSEECSCVLLADGVLQIQGGSISLRSELHACTATGTSGSTECLSSCARRNAALLTT